MGVDILGKVSEEDVSGRLTNTEEEKGYEQPLPSADDAVFCLTEADNTEKTPEIVTEPLQEDAKPYGHGSFYETETDFLSGRKNYTFYLSQFEGPLDLLCSMLKNHEIKIEDFFLSELTEQYIEIVTKADLTIDMDYAGEFITTLAELLYIKSLRLLPTEKEANIEAEVSEQEFLRRLEEHQMFKEMSARIKTAETINRFARQPVYTDKDYQLSIKNFSFDKLIDAFALLISRLDREEEAIEPKIVRKERYSVANRISHISTLIFYEKKTSFFKMFEEDFNTAEVCNTFFAVLELVARQYIVINQEEEFSDILIELAEGVAVPFIIDETEVKLITEEM